MLAGCIFLQKKLVEGQFFEWRVINDSDSSRNAHLYMNWISFTLFCAKILMFNLGHNYMSSVTVSDGRRSSYNETEIHNLKEKGLTNLWVAYHQSALSCALVSM
jgi:hypothetical protein